MKALLYILSIGFIFLTSPVTQEKQKKLTRQAEIKHSVDSTEYELLVFDAGFESYLSKVPYSKEYYGNSYFKSWNLQYVAEWNIRAINPLQFGSIYENQIDYRSNIDYGLALNFKLYHYFKFFEKKHGVVLIRRK